MGRDKAMVKAYLNRGLFRHVARLFYWFRRMGVVPLYFFLSITCAVVAIFFNLTGLRLFIPFLRGILEGDFTKVHSRFSFERVFIERFPEVFDGSGPIFVLLVGLIFVSFAAKSGLEYASALLMSRQIRQVDRHIRMILFERYLGFGKQFFDSTNVANIQHMILGSASAVSGQFGQLKKMIQQLMALAMYLGVMFWISWKLTLAAILLFPGQHLVTERFVHWMRGASKMQEGLRVDFSQKILSVFSCIGLVKSYAYEEEERRRLERSSDEEIRLAYEIQKKQLLVKPVQDLISMMTLLLMVFVMTLVSRDRAEAASYLVFFYVMRLAGPHFGAISNFRFSIASVEGIFERFRGLMDSKLKMSVPSGSRKFTGLRQGIKFMNLSFEYRPGRPILENVTFTVEKGRMTAIVGATGAGKSTLVQLLMRFYGCAPGSIRLDGTDIREYSTASLMERICYVSQEPLLFDESLKANIIYGLRRQVSEDELRAALRRSQLEELVDRLPEGLQTMIGDRGVKLSGGERQRVALARTFLKGADILIFDEATSALDTRTEQKIQEAIHQVIADHTAIVIAHRLSTIVKADKIVVLEKGRIAEQGTLRGLLQSEGVFYTYWAAQKYSDAPRTGTLVP